MIDIKPMVTLHFHRSVTIAMQTSIPPTVSALVSTVALLLCLALLLMLCVLKKKRRMEGTYRPSAEERKQIGGSRSDKSGLPLPLPKEERLI
ncbi:protein crumbs homolog 3b [Entelurus aequoreus]|uniref:protein crumbs homolog 3b n=1 Tax=Entelurus aequoreus TaxID=161455 RepID=UPI002B1E0206|nr:protein crumbs homolog 3b [Entelurus aequoreus]